MNRRMILFSTIIRVDTKCRREYVEVIYMQKDWKRDPIWTSLGVMVAIVGLVFTFVLAPTDKQLLLIRIIVGIIFLVIIGIIFRAIVAAVQLNMPYAQPTASYGSDSYPLPIDPSYEQPTYSYRSDSHELASYQPPTPMYIPPPTKQPCCPNCNTPYGSGNSFCNACGLWIKPLLERAK